MAGVREWGKRAWQQYMNAARIERIFIRNGLAWPFSLVYVGFNFIVAVWYRASWMLLLSSYYLVLLLARTYVLRYFHRERQSAHVEGQADAALFYRGAGLLIGLGVTFAGFCAIMFKNGYHRRFDQALAILIATMCAIKMTTAIVGLVRARKDHSSLLGLLKAFSFADALVAIVTTQYAPLTVDKVKYAARITGAFGLVLANALILLGIALIALQRRRGWSTTRQAASVPQPQPAPLTREIGMKKRTPYHVLRLPMMLFMLIIGFAALYVARTSTNITLSSGWLTYYSDIPIDWQEQIIVGGLLAEEALLWFGDWLVRRGRWLLLLPQLGFAVSTTLALSNQMPVIFFGVIPIMAIEIINLYSRPKRVLGGLAGVCLVIWLAYVAFNGWGQGAAVLVGLVFMLLVVWAYWRFFQQQQAARQRAEDLVSELKIAYSQVEESTVRTERQRVARELHDTLTQGLAGTVMQLEAAQAFLQAGKTDRAQEVIQGATGIARDTLRDTRLTLTDLRATSEQSLTARLELLADAFKKNYQLAVSIKMKAVPDYSGAQLTEISRIVSEALINVVKHTDTKQAIVRGEALDDIFRLQVIDFGDGTIVKKKSGHFGMQGMHERAAALEGALTVVSTPGEGTTVNLTMPVTKKEQL